MKFALVRVFKGTDKTYYLEIDINKFQVKFAGAAGMVEIVITENTNAARSIFGPFDFVEVINREFTEHEKKYLSSWK